MTDFSKLSDADIISELEKDDLVVEFGFNIVKCQKCGRPTISVDICKCCGKDQLDQ